MSPNFIPTNRNQQYLFPPSVQDWLPEDHLNVFSCEQAKIEPFISPGREKHHQSFAECFAKQEPLPEDADSISKSAISSKLMKAANFMQKERAQLN